MKYARIIGTGRAIPEKILTNFDLEKMVDTSNEWIIKRTGIEERHIIGDDQKLSELMEIAAKNAIEAAEIDKNQIDLIITANVTSELAFPSLACILQKKLEINNFPAFDISSGCAGFIYLLDLADKYIKSGSANTILLVVGDALSKVTDWTDRTTCVLFGDGAGAVIIKADDEPGIYSVHLNADGNYYDLLYAPSGLYDEKPYTKMRGNETFKIAVTKLSEIIQESIDKNNIDVSEIDWLVPHQANLRIIAATAKKLNLPMERVLTTIKKYGNTSASSIPIALDTAVRDGRIKKGDTILMDAFGSGLVWGAALLDY